MKEQPRTSGVHREKTIAERDGRTAGLEAQIANAIKNIEAHRMHPASPSY